MPLFFLEVITMAKKIVKPQVKVLEVEVYQTANGSRLDYYFKCKQEVMKALTEQGLIPKKKERNGTLTQRQSITYAMLQEVKTKALLLGVELQVYPIKVHKLDAPNYEVIEGQEMNFDVVEHPVYAP